MRPSCFTDDDVVARNYEIEDADRMNDEMVIATMRCGLAQCRAWICLMPNLVLLTAAISSIVLGGQETTAGALSRLLCLMAENPELQQRLRDELVAARAVCCFSHHLLLFIDTF